MTPTSIRYQFNLKVVVVVVLLLPKMQGAQKIYLPHVPGRPLAIKQILRYIAVNNC